MKKFIIPLLTLIISILLWVFSFGKIIYKVYPCSPGAGPLPCHYFYDVYIDYFALLLFGGSLIAVIFILYKNKKAKL
jgi:hypothetical protein